MEPCVGLLMGRGTCLRCSKKEGREGRGEEGRETEGGRKGGREGHGRGGEGRGGGERERRNVQHWKCTHLSSAWLTLSPHSGLCSNVPSPEALPDLPFQAGSCPVTPAPSPVLIVPHPMLADSGPAPLWIWNSGEEPCPVWAPGPGNWPVRTPR